MKLNLKNTMKKMKMETPGQLQIFLSKMDTVIEVNGVIFFLSEKKNK